MNSWTYIWNLSISLYIYIYASIPLVHTIAKNMFISIVMVIMAMAMAISPDVPHVSSWFNNMFTLFPRDHDHLTGRKPVYCNWLSLVSGSEATNGGAQIFQQNWLRCICQVSKLISNRLSHWTNAHMPLLLTLPTLVWLIAFAAKLRCARIRAAGGWDSYQASWIKPLILCFLAMKW